MTDPHAGADGPARHPSAAGAGPTPFGERGPFRPGLPGDRDGYAYDPREYAAVVTGVDGLEDRSPPPGQVAVVMAALMLGLLLMGTQLWLLTVALELYLGGHGRQVWLLAVVSGLIFVGGLLVLKILGRRPHLTR